MFKNPLREQLRRGQTAYGLWITMESPAITEIATILACDWICIDMEHGPLDFGPVAAHARAARGSQTAVLVRVPEIQQGTIKRVLDLGVHGVLLPMIRSAEELERGMRLARYPPHGIRGIGGERAVRWGLGLREYLQSANEEVLVIPIVETREAAEGIDSLLAVPGVEVLFFGPADFSASYGYPGEWEGPGVAERLLAIKARAAAAGVACGVMSRSVADAQRRREQGFGMVGLGSDAGLLIRSAGEALRALRGEDTLHLGF
jgi:2-keto-3-deoxy-L-rhamnonate aldolase RhmA